MIVQVNDFLIGMRLWNVALSDSAAILGISASVLESSRDDDDFKLSDEALAMVSKIIVLQRSAKMMIEDGIIDYNWIHESLPGITPRCMSALEWIKSDRAAIDHLSRFFLGYD